MNLERAMEFIVERQAAAEVEMAEIRRMSAKMDRKVDALSKLVRVGMRILAKQEERLAKQDERLAKQDERLDKQDERLDKHDERMARHERELAEERKRSDQRFQQLVQSLVRAVRNGH